MRGRDNKMHQLRKGRFIEIFKIEEIDDSIFRDYQRYDFHQILWFTEVEKEGKYFIDFKDFTFSDNEIIVVFPGQIDKLDTEGKKGFVFAVDNETFFRINQAIDSDYLSGYYSNVFVQVDEPTNHTLESLIRLIMLEYNGENRIALMESYLNSFLFHVVALFERSSVYQENNDNTVSQQVSELMKLIDIHFVNERDISFYARKLGLSHKRLYEISLKGTGHTVKYHINERLLLEMKKEIKLGQMSLKEIAFSLGFNEPAYFSRFFKHHTSMTPKEYRDKG